MINKKPHRVLGGVRMVSKILWRNYSLPTRRVKTQTKIKRVKEITYCHYVISIRKVFHKDKFFRFAKLDSICIMNALSLERLLRQRHSSDGNSSTRAQFIEVNPTGQIPGIERNTVFSCWLYFCYKRF